jgi:hypothetical protein
MLDSTMWSLVSFVTRQSSVYCLHLFSITSSNPSGANCSIAVSSLFFLPNFPLFLPRDSSWCWDSIQITLACDVCRTVPLFLHSFLSNVALFASILTMSHFLLVPCLRHHPALSNFTRPFCCEELNTRTNSLDTRGKRRLVVPFSLQRGRLPMADTGRERQRRMVGRLFKELAEPSARSRSSMDKHRRCNDQVTCQQCPEHGIKVGMALEHATMRLVLSVAAVQAPIRG